MKYAIQSKWLSPCGNKGVVSLVTYKGTEEVILFEDIGGKGVVGTKEMVKALEETPTEKHPAGSVFKLIPIIN